MNDDDHVEGTIRLPAEHLRELVREVVREELAAAGAGQEGPPSPYLTVAEAAVYANAPEGWVRDQLTVRRFTRIKRGSRTLLLRRELEDHLLRGVEWPAKPAEGNGARARWGCSLDAPMLASATTWRSSQEREHR